MSSSSSSSYDHGPLPPHHHTHASPLRFMKPPAHAPTTPATAVIQQLRAERALHQPSPNRTEAAAAMMHLFASSKSDTSLQLRLPVHPPVPGAKVKRKYVRKAPRKPSSAAKKLAKITETVKEEEEAAGNDMLHDNDNNHGDDEQLFVDAACEQASAASADGDDEMGGDKSNAKDVDGGENNGDFAPFREYNRKEKSLGLLCENFLKLYRSDQVTEICLDRAATQLGVERRRIYDIVNILESIHLVSRKSKNLYNWHGLGALPVSTAAMKKKYIEMQLQGDQSGANSYESYNFKDRRRGKSLSKLSQLFVQLFLVKDHCIIPLDQAAKQLIQMEESESEEDRQLKTKIRRLYDVANVLVSVGLIEKMQLTNSRKPVFRWKHRTGAAGAGAGTSNNTMMLANDHVPSLMSRLRVDRGVHVEPLVIKKEPLSAASHRNRFHSPMVDESDAMDAMVKTSQSQSGDSDNNADDDSSSNESPSSAKETGGGAAGAKRKQPPNPHHRASASADAHGTTATATGATSKRPKKSSSSSQSLSQMSSMARQDTTTATMSLSPSSASSSSQSSVLRFSSQNNNTPIHPQIIYQEQQQQVRQYMERYIHEYIDHIIAQQVRDRDPPLALGGLPATTTTTTTSSTSCSMLAKDVAASMTLDIQRTPVSIPQFMNRVVSSELAGSIHDILFPMTAGTASTSPQSVAELLQPIDTHNVTKSLQSFGLTGVAAPPLPPSASSSPQRPGQVNLPPSFSSAKFLHAGTEPPRDAAATAQSSTDHRSRHSFNSDSSPVSSPCSSSSSSSSSSSDGSSSGSEDMHLQARRLFNTAILQPPATNSTTTATTTADP